MKPVVFIHTNDKQLIGAKLAAHSFKTRSAHPDKFDVRLLRLEETPHLTRREGQDYLRKGKHAVWRNDDLQSFSPLRMMVPQAMGYQGRALVTDPDVFAVGDVWDLLSMDMGDQPIWCRHVVEGYRGNGHRFFASSVMLLDCARLKHWQWDRQIDDMFAKKWDYGPWIGLLTEPEENIGELGEEWNSFDKLTPETRLLHNTERSTQPWKTGLPVDYDTTWRKRKQAQQRAAAEKTAPPPGGLLRRLLDRLTGTAPAAPAAADETVEEFYLPHPDPAQERFFFDLLKEALEQGVITESFIQDEMKLRHVRPDALQALRRIA
jgi:hypothetical protein